MNLKQAAVELGVHYQTAYKWVRSGSLPAVRVGSRYEISDDAVSTFMAQRRWYAGAATPDETPSEPPEMTPEDLIEEAESMLLDPLLSTHAVAVHVARRLSATFRSLCVVSLTRHDGSHITVFDHPRADWITFIASLRDLAPIDPDAVAGVVTSLRAGQTLRVSHVPVDEFVHWLRPEMRMHLARYPIRSLLGVPITKGDEVNGFVILTRDGGVRPAFDDADEVALRRFGERVSDLVATAHDIRGAWDLRAALIAAITHWGARQYGPLYAGDAQRIIDDLAAHSDLGVCIFDREGYIVAANHAFVAEARLISADAPIGLRFDELVDPEYREGEQRRWNRLVSGAIDYDDVKASRQLADDRAGLFGYHRCAVRRADGTLVVVVCVTRRLHGTFEPQLLRRFAEQGAGDGDPR